MDKDNKLYTRLVGSEWSSCTTDTRPPLRLLCHACGVSHEAHVTLLHHRRGTGSEIEQADPLPIETPPADRVHSTNQIKDAHNTGFLFGARNNVRTNEDATEDSYSSIFLDSRESNFTPDENDRNNSETPAILKTPYRPTLFNFLAPFARYFWAIMSANLLVKITSLTPTVLPTSGHLKTTYVNIAAAIMMLDFLCLSLRHLQWFPSSAPFLNPTKNFGRSIFSTFGRNWWYAWYLTQPARLLLTLTPCIMAVGLIVVLNNSGSLQNHSPGTAMIQAAAWSRNLLFVSGMSGLIWAATNYMMEKAWEKQAVWSVCCFVFGAVSSLIITFSQANPADLDSTFLTR